MDKIFDYLNKYGDISFKKMKFNEIDALIFSALAYLNFEELAMPIKTLRFLSEREVYKITYNTTQREKNIMLITAIKNSQRYSKVKVMHQMTENKVDDQSQFSGTSFIIGPRTIVISFRGTDGTVLGWKENLMMGYNKEIPAQRKAYQYYKHVKKLHYFSKFYLCGHSKGGNLAYYVGLRSLQEKTKNRILHIFNFDGPGFINKGLFENGEYKRNSECFSKYIPEESLIGILLDNGTDRSIIKSDGSKFEQHSLFNWCVDINRKEILMGEGRTELSIKAEAIFNELFSRMNPEEIKNIIDLLESILGCNMSMYIDEINIAKPAILLWKFFRYDSIPKEQKKKIKDDLLYLYTLIKDSK